MSYPIITLEITRPLPAIALRRRDNGIALLVRCHDKPLGFCLVPLTRAERAQNVLTPQFLLRCWERHGHPRLGTAVLEARLRAELAPALTASPGLASLTVAICTKDQAENLKRCLASIQALDPCVREQRVDVEVLVVDNAPSDLSTHRVARAATGPFAVRYTLEPKPGLDFARNRALHESRGELLAFVDDDVVVDRGWLAGLLEAHADHPDAGAFTGLILPLELESRAQLLFEQRGGFRRGFDTMRWEPYSPDPIYPRGAGVFGTGANMAFRRDLLLELGGFDEALDTGRPLPGGGDLDIFYRVVRAGYPLIYEPRYLLFHQHRREMKALRRQYWSWGSGLAAYAAKHYAAEPDRRRGWRALGRWWFGYKWERLRLALRRPHRLPPYLVLNEIWGGVQGWCGEYRRSQARIAQIRREHPDSDPVAAHGQCAIPPATAPAPPREFAPWQIRHFDLSREVPALTECEQDDGILAVFWWRDLPLTHHWFAARQLPLSARAVVETVLPKLTQSVEARLANALPRPPQAAQHALELEAALCIEQPLRHLEAQLEAREQASPLRDATISVAICTRERAEELERCLSSMRHLRPAPDEIVVVDNAPATDATRRVVERMREALPALRYVLEARPGLDAARNAVVRAARGEILAFTDDDVEVHPAWLRGIRRGFADPKVMAVTGLVLPAELQTPAQWKFERQWSFGRGYAPILFDQRWFRPHSRIAVPTWEVGAGANMAFRRELFARVGGFDERLDAGAAGCSGDSEMWYRVLAEGDWCCYEPSAVVHHTHRRDDAGLSHQLFAYMKGHVAALLVQHQRHRHRSNLRRAFGFLPVYYARLVRGRLRRRLMRHLRRLPITPDARLRDLAEQISGCVAGVAFFWKHRHQPAHTPRFESAPSADEPTA